MDNGVDIIRNIYEGFDLGDLAPLLDSLDPDVEWNEAEHVSFWPGEAFRGPAAIVEGLFSDTWLFAEATGITPYTA